MEKVENQRNKQFQQDCSNIKRTTHLLDSIEVKLKAYMGEGTGSSGEPAPGTSKRSSVGFPPCPPQYKPKENRDSGLINRVQSREFLDGHSSVRDSSLRPTQSTLQDRISLMDQKITRFKTENERFKTDFAKENLRGRDSLVSPGNAMARIPGYQSSLANSQGTLNSVVFPKELSGNRLDTNRGSANLENVSSQRLVGGPSQKYDEYFDARAKPQILRQSSGIGRPRTVEASLGHEDEKKRMMELVDAQKQMIWEMQEEMKKEKEKTKILQNNIVKYDNLVYGIKNKLETTESIRNSLAPCITLENLNRRHRSSACEDRIDAYDNLFNKQSLERRERESQKSDSRVLPQTATQRNYTVDSSIISVGDAADDQPVFMERKFSHANQKSKTSSKREVPVKSGVSKKDNISTLSKGSKQSSQLSLKHPLKRKVATKASLETEKIPKRKSVDEKSGLRLSKIEATSVKNSFLKRKVKSAVKPQNPKNQVPEQKKKRITGEKSGEKDSMLEKLTDLLSQKFIDKLFKKH